MKLKFTGLKIVWGFLLSSTISALSGMGSAIYYGAKIQGLEQIQINISKLIYSWSDALSEIPKGEIIMTFSVTSLFVLGIFVILFGMISLLVVLTTFKKLSIYLETNNQPKTKINQYDNRVEPNFIQSNQYASNISNQRQPQPQQRLEQNSQFENNFRNPERPKRTMARPTFNQNSTNDSTLDEILGRKGGN